MEVWAFFSWFFFFGFGSDSCIIYRISDVGFACINWIFELLFRAVRLVFSTIKKKKKKNSFSHFNWEMLQIIYFTVWWVERSRKIGENLYYFSVYPTILRLAIRLNVVNFFLFFFWFCFDIWVKLSYSSLGVVPKVLQ